MPREVGSSNTERSSGSGGSGIVLLTLAAGQFLMTPERPRAYGLVTSAGAIAVAAGPLIGGLFTTYLSWRWVFVGEVLIVLAILALARRMADATPDAAVRLDFVGTVLSALGLGLLVNTLTNLGASIGTALGGAVLISALSASFIAGIQNNPAVPGDVKHKAQVQLAGGVPFVSDADLNAALKEAGVSSKTAVAVVAENTTARLDGLRSSLSVMAIIALIALPFTRRLPAHQPTSAAATWSPAAAGW